MKSLEWICIAMSRAKENQKFSGHGKERKKEYSTKGRRDSSLHLSEISPKISIRANKHIVEASQH